jgi:hypothetical protein
MLFDNNVQVPRRGSGGHSARIPYAMQLGSGTWDVKLGITYNGSARNFTWGAQYMGAFRSVGVVVRFRISLYIYND